MTTFCLLRERRIEGRRRLSRGSFEWQTRQGQPSVGTPIEVPEPRTVIFSGVRGILAIRIEGEAGARLCPETNQERACIQPVKRFEAQQEQFLRRSCSGAYACCRTGLVPARSARFRLGLRCRLSRHGLVNLDVSHFELAKQVKQQIVFFGSQVAFGFFMQGVEHVD